MKALIKAAVMSLTTLIAACGSGSDSGNGGVAPATPTVNVAMADISAESPSADIGFGECRFAATQEEIEARTSTKALVNGVALTYRYDTVYGPYYLSEDASRSLQIFNKQGFARITVSCQR